VSLTCSDKQFRDPRGEILALFVASGAIDQEIFEVGCPRTVRSAYAMAGMCHEYTCRTGDCRPAPISTAQRLGSGTGECWKCMARRLSVQTRAQACVPWGSNSRRQTPRSLPVREAVAATFGPATTTLGRTQATPANGAGSCFRWSIG